MLIKQLSIFLENKKGRFTEVAKILGEAGVNILSCRTQTKQFRYFVKNYMR